MRSIQHFEEVEQPNWPIGQNCRVGANRTPQAAGILIEASS